MASILAFVIARNHDWSLRRAVRSLIGIAQEIVVLDRSSTDSTVLVAEHLNVRLVNSASRVVGQEVLRLYPSDARWIMILAGNEELSSDLQDEISYIFDGELQDLYEAYELNVVIMGRREFSTRKLSYCFRSLRLYSRSYFESLVAANRLSFDESVLCCRPKGQRGIYLLENDVVLRTSISLDYLVDQANFSSSARAYSVQSRMERRPSIIKILFSPIGVWFHTYFIRRYFVFGFSGFVDSYLEALKEFLFLVKLREEHDLNVTKR